MYPTLASSRNDLTRLDWISKVVRATPAALAERDRMSEMSQVTGRVSVVTVCFNAAKTIASAFASVESQTYNHVEYIVVDGGSTDGTLDEIRYCSRIDLAISLPDNGIADAFNRGAAMATGEFIAFLNSDDAWPAWHLSAAVAALKKNSTRAFVFGDLVRVNEKIDRYYILRGDPDYRSKLRGWPPQFNHPSFVTLQSAFYKIGLFDTKYQICMDLDWIMRLDRADLSGVKVDGLWVVMRCGGVSDQLSRMFSDVRSILEAAGTPRWQAAGLVWRAQLKTAVKEILESLGAVALADHLRHVHNRNFVASDSHLVASARQLVQSTRAC